MLTLQWIATNKNHLFAGLLIFGILSCGNDHSRIADPLINAFQNSCSSSGRWTDIALKQNDRMVSMFKDLKNNDPCKAVSGSLASIQNLSVQISLLLKNDSFSRYRQAEEKLQELTLALQTSQDKSLSQALGNELIKTKLELASARAHDAAISDLNEKNQYEKATAQFAQYIQNLIMESSSISQCLRESPGAAVQLASNLVSLGGSFISPVYGAGAAIVGQLINLGIEFITKQEIDEAVFELYKAKMPQALTCGFESLAASYCQANDAFDLLELQAKSYPNNNKSPHPIWKGMDLLNRRLPRLFQWINKVRNGVTPNDPSEAAKQNRIWEKIYKLDSMNRIVLGMFNENQRLYNKAQGNPTIQESILFQTIRNISWFLANPPSRTSTPFADFNSESNLYSCWLAQGPPSVTGTPCPDYDNTVNLSRYINEHFIKNADFISVFSNWKSILDIVSKTVEVAFSETITVDPESLVTAAFESSADNLSPFDIIGEVIEFLDQMQDGGNPRRPGLIVNTRKMLFLVRDVLSKENQNKSDLNRVQEIFKILELRKGILFINERLAQFIEWDIQDQIKAGDYPDNIEGILIEAGLDVRRRLVAAGVRNLDEVSLDLNHARTLTQGNIDVFRTFFERALTYSMKMLYRKSIENDEPSTGANRPNGQLLAQLCTLVLTTGNEWPSSVPWKYCHKATLNSVYPDPTGELTIQLASLRDLAKNQNFQTKICTFYRFLRAGRLAESLRRPQKQLRPQDRSSALIPETLTSVWTKASSHFWWDWISP